MSFRRQLLKSSLIDQTFLCLQESRERLGELESILTQINESGILAEKKNGALNESHMERLGVISRSNSLPREAESRTFRSYSAGSKQYPAHGPRYEDAVLSGAQDYVSGCSLITHTSLKPKGFTFQRTKGRAGDMRSQILNSTGKGKEHQSRKYREDEKYLVSSEPSNFLRSSSFHGRSSRDGKPSLLTPSKSFDTDGAYLFKFGHNGLSSAKSDSRLRSKSDQNCRSDLKLDLDRSKAMLDGSGRTLTSSASLNVILDQKPANPTNPTNAGEKTIRRLPDIIHESVTWNDITDRPDQPLYFSPATEPMTPLGNRQFKFGFDSLVQAQQGHDGNDALIGSQGAASSKTRVTIPISYNSWSSKSSDSDSLVRTSSQRDIVSSAATLSGVKSDQVASDVNSSLDKPSIDQDHPFEDAAQSEGCPAQPSSSAAFAARERGSTCSLDTCSCTSSDDFESGEHHRTHAGNGNIGVAYEAYSG